MVELAQHQIDALKKMHNGCILRGDVGSGKSRTALAYYYIQVCKGMIRVNLGDSGTAHGHVARYLYVAGGRRAAH